MPFRFSHLRRAFSVHARSPLLASLATRHPPAPALHHDPSPISYSDLLARAVAIRPHLPNVPGPVALFLPPDSTFVPALLATWSIGSIAVPLSPLFPAAALAPLLDTVAPLAIITTPTLRHALPPVAAPVCILDSHQADSLPPVKDYSALCLQMASAADKKAIIFFTSGTTGKPKGVVWTHRMLHFQLDTLSTAWRWSSHDRVLNVLPLHHIHGLVNVVLSAVYNGALLEMHNAFDAHSVWQAILRNPHSNPPPPTVFMAVPAIYKKLILYYQAATEPRQKAMRRAAARLRLYVCGSASLSKRDFRTWFDIAGHRILERYGMTETGMTLSNLYDNRHQGMLGLPFPQVETKVQDSLEMGQLLVRGPGVFSEYWNDPHTTSSSFTKDGWFETGDVVSVQPSTGFYKLMGRANADIIKTGAYKVSALEIEDVLRECPGVVDCSVIGLPDDILGQKILAAVIVQDGDTTLEHIRKRAMEHLPKYKVPRHFIIVDDFPRNVLGKVQKQVLKTRLGV